MQARRGRRGDAGLSLVELLVSVTILAILAGTALPMARLTTIHAKEVELKEALRAIRKGIDKFYDRADRKSPDQDEVKKYPATLEDLVENQCLRRIPRDPFCPDEDLHPPARCWEIIASTDTPAAAAPEGGPFAKAPFTATPLSGGQKENVYDVRSRSGEVSPFAYGSYSEQ